MLSLTNFLSVLRGSIWTPWKASVLVLVFVFGAVGRPAAQAPRYTIDDVMEKLMEMDKKFEVRLGKLETRVDHLEKRMEADKVDLNTRFDHLEKQMQTDKADLKERIADVKTTVWTLFGVLSVGLFGMVAFLFSISNKMGGLVERMRQVEVHLEAILARRPMEREKEPSKVTEESALASPPEWLRSLQDQIRELADHQRELEEKLTAANVI